MKVWNYIFISITLTLFLELLGFATGITDLLSGIIGINYDVETGIGTFSLLISNVFNYIFDTAGGLLTLMGASIAVGTYITRSSFSAENLIIAGFAGAVCANFLSTFGSIITMVWSYHSFWLSSIVMMIFVPLSFGFFFSIVEFIRGTD